MSFTPNTNNINTAYADIDTGFPISRPIWTQNFNIAYADTSTAGPLLVPIFKTANIFGANSEIESGEWAYYPEYNSISEIEQNAISNFIAAETLLYITYSNDIIQQFAPELLTGVTYTRLLEIAHEVPEISIITEPVNNILVIMINEIEIKCSI